MVGLGWRGAWRPPSFFIDPFCWIFFLSALQSHPVMATTKEKKATSDSARQEDGAATGKKSAYHSWGKKRRAFEAYLDDTPLDEISARYDIPVTTLKSWIATKGWKDKKTRVQGESIRQIESRYSNIISKNQLAILNRKLSTAALIDRAIKTRLLNSDGTFKNLTDEQIRNIADAFSKNTNVDAKLVGLLSPQNQLSVIAAPGAMVNIGIQGRPAAELPPPPMRTQGYASPPAYEEEGRMIPGAVPF